MSLPGKIKINKLFKNGKKVVKLIKINLINIRELCKAKKKRNLINIQIF